MGLGVLQPGWSHGSQRRAWQPGRQCRADGLNVGDSDGVIRRERSKWRGVWVRQAEHLRPRQEGVAANCRSSPSGHPEQPQLSLKVAPMVTQSSPRGAGIPCAGTRHRPGTHRHPGTWHHPSKGAGSFAGVPVVGGAGRRRLLMPGLPGSHVHHGVLHPHAQSWDESGVPQCCAGTESPPREAPNPPGADSPPPPPPTLTVNAPSATPQLGRIL